MKPNYTRVMRVMTGDPWAILPQKLEAICGVIEARVNGAPAFSPDELKAMFGGQQAAAGMSLQGGGAVAVIPLVGVLAPKMDLMVNFSGGTSLESFRNQFRRAVADSTVKGIIIAINSPGGSVVGCKETWSDVMAARGSKPIVASVDYLMASAALWIGSACDAIEITPSGEAGSLGVYTVHEDFSEAEQAAGIKVTYIVAGISPYKTEGNADEPLADTAKAYIKGRVDAVADTFLRQVAKGRGLSPSAVQKTFGEGRTLFADEAVAVKMVDRIATFEQTVTRLLGGKGRSAGTIALAAGTMRLVAGIVPHDVSSKLAPRDTEWSALTLGDFTDKGWNDLTADEKHAIAGHFAWAASMPPESFGDLKLGHHRASDGAAVFRGVADALGRLDQTDLPAADKPKVKAHLEHHEQQFEQADQKPAARADHTDVGRDADGTFHPQCDCDPACPCIQDGPDLCPDDCLTCQPTCVCVNQQLAAAAADEQAILAAILR